MWSRAPLHKLIVLWLFKKFLISYRIKRFVMMFTGASRLYISSAKLI